jgi:hypothetical protein
MLRVLASEVLSAALGVWFAAFWLVFGVLLQALRRMLEATQRGIAKLLIFSRFFLWEEVKNRIVKASL